MAWCEVDKLSINAKKTKYMLLDPYNIISDLPIQPVIKLGEENLEEVSPYNYLGVMLDNKLSFEKFMKEKCRKINLRIYQLGKMRKYIDKNVSNIIHKQTIVPLFDYADFLIESGPNHYHKRLTSLHEKVGVTIEGKMGKQVNMQVLETHYRL